jgi:hypothetical protein
VHQTVGGHGRPGVEENDALAGRRLDELVDGPVFVPILGVDVPADMAVAELLECLEHA